MINRDKLEDIWMAMLGRCARTGHLKSEVCDEWKVFENFAAWASVRYFHGAHLDKDVLGDGKRLYSPETSAFVSRGLNYWYSTGKWLHNKHVKVRRVDGWKRFEAVVGKQRLGIFLTEKKAREASQEYLLGIMAQFAYAEPDPRIKARLLSFKFK
jgi:hypothetical protein